uniref:Uncharacterized protein n=1 Tax=Arundo donax TaxID=35708 RepID=A0A0A8ZU98_ARUDO
MLFPPSHKWWEG